MQRIRDYLIALGVLMATYAIYAQTAVRMIEPAALQISSNGDGKPVAPPPPSRMNPYAHLFQPNHWELDSPKILETAGGTLIFQDYQPQDQGRLEIHPCTLILYSSDKSADSPSQSARPIIMRANKGAVLHFDEDLDLSRGQFGRLVGGRILGDIHLYSPESSPGAGDAMDLTTQYLQIEQLRLFTPSEVRFSYGSSHGIGQDLVVNLSPAENLSGKGKTSPIGGVESVQLSHVKELHLEPRQANILPLGDSATPRTPSEPSPPVRITCDGPLRFDVTRRIATFDDNVIVQRMMPNGITDRLRCEQLAIFFASDKKTAAQPPAGVAEAKSGSGEIERIVAIGKPVVLDAPSQSAYTEAERLEYNLQTRQVLLKALTQGNQILLRHGVDEFRAPELAYEMVVGKRIGKLVAPGPGALSSTSGQGLEAKTFSARWRDELRIRPHEANQLISLMGTAQVAVQGQGSFEANELHFWLLELPSVSPTTVTPAGTTTTAETQLVPDRLLALDNVRANSPQLSAEVKRLEAWFQQLPATLPAAVATGERPMPNTELVLAPAEGAPELEPARSVLPIQEPSAMRRADTRETAAVDNAPPVQHFHVTGDVIRLQIMQRGKESSVDQITVEGNKVRVVEANADKAIEPLTLSGTKLMLEGGTDINARITVQGAPANVSARGMSLRSKVLKLSRRDNRLTVDQDGTMSLPLSEGFHGEQLADPEQLTIAWKGSMIFDGLSAKFRKQVTVKGITYWAASEELQAILSNRIDFAKSRPTAENKTEVRRLVMSGGVELENRSFSAVDGRQQSIEHMSALSLEIDQITGAVQGAGPGWLSRVQVGAPAAPGATPATPLEPRSNGENPSDGLTYLRVDFRKGLEGNLKQRQIAFQEQVQAVFGPVMHWDDRVQPDSRDALGPQGMVLTTKRLELADLIPPGASSGSMEMSAVGDTRVEGRDFTTYSHRLTYTAAKSQLILEGDGRKEAEIRHQFQNSVAAQKIYFWQNTNTIQIDGAKNINIGPANARAIAPPRAARDAIQPR